GFVLAGCDFAAATVRLRQPRSDTWPPLKSDSAERLDRARSAPPDSPTAVAAAVALVALAHRKGDPVGERLAGDTAAADTAAEDTPVEDILAAAEILARTVTNS